MIPYGRQSIDESDKAAVLDVLSSDWLTTGPKIQEFESDFSRYVHARHSVAVSSGTSALDIAVQALDLPRGSEVITTPFTFVATANAILYNGLVPIFADISPVTRNINYLDIKEKITPKTKAIIYVDYAGHPCNIDELRSIAVDKDLMLIEDACHALGAEYKSRKVGRFADATIFSFHPVKHITTGEGGMITTNNEELASKMRVLRNHGLDTTFKERTGYEYDMKYLGRNYRMTDMQAALGISQLKRIDEFIERRTYLASRYSSALAPLSEIISTPTVGPCCKHAWHLYTVFVDRRDQIFKSMRNRGIGVNVHYIPIYHFSYYQKRFNISYQKYPETEYVFSRILTLPLYPTMMDTHVDMVVEALEESVRWEEK